MELSNPHHHLVIKVDGRDVPVLAIAETQHEANEMMRENSALGLLDTSKKGAFGLYYYFLADVHDLGTRS